MVRPESVEEALDAAKDDPALLQITKRDILNGDPPVEVKEAVRRWSAKNPGAFQQLKKANHEREN